MHFINNDQTVFFDVDETLVKWESERSIEEAIFISDGSDINAYVWPHHKHIEQLKKHHARGHAIIVWSAGGSKWAEAVVHSLGLEHFVNLVVRKPNWFYDDLTSPEFMPEINRVFYKEE